MVTIVPEPPSKVQLPVPTAGVFAAIVAVVAQTDCDGPATEVEGKSYLKMLIVEVEAGHTPLDMVH